MVAMSPVSNQPSADGLFGFLGPAPVAQHNLRPARGHLARLPWRHGLAVLESRQATSVEGNGTPIELLRVRPRGLKVITGDDSVSP
jgi:hypothetical protein